MSYEKQWIEEILKTPLESKKDAFKIKMEIQNSPLCYQVQHGDESVTVCTQTLQVPKIFTQEDKKIFEHICDTMVSIFHKTIEAYQSDQAVRRLFRFSPFLNHLVCQSEAYEERIPMLRVDIFYNEQTRDFKFCEFNTDGTSAMFENALMADFFQQSDLWKKMNPDAQPMELMDSWADALLKDSAQAGFDHPAIAICDILENAYLPELQAFEKLFQKRGYACEVVDLRDLGYDGNKLYSTKTGQTFDVIYRRAVTKDVVEHVFDIQPFMRAVHDRNIVLIGGFQTQIPHSKAISEALQSEALRKYLTKEEVEFLDRHLPKTFDLTPATARKLLADKDRWIIKPKDGYGAKGVWAGVDVPERLWSKLVYDAGGMGYVAQEYIPHYKTPNIDLIHNDQPGMFSNLTGLYVYNGKFAGVYSRLSDAAIVSTQYNERMVPTFFTADKKDESDNSAQLEK